MRKGTLAAAALTFLVALSWSSAQAMPLSASALKGASASLGATDNVNCWDDCYYGPPRRTYRPYYRSYYDDGPHYRSYYRPYVRRYYDDGPRYYAPPYRAPWWVSRPYYGQPRAFYVGPNVYWY